MRFRSNELAITFDEVRAYVFVAFASLEFFSYNRLHVFRDLSLRLIEALPVAYWTHQLLRELVRSLVDGQIIFGYAG